MAQDKKLLLRVLIKLMVLVVVLLFAYVLIAGLIQQPDHQSQRLSIDVSDLQPGESRVQNSGHRWFMLIFRRDAEASAKPYIVLQAQDMVYGCQVQHEAETAQLKSTCADVVWDLEGHLVKGTRDHEDLPVPPHEWVDPHRVQIHLE